MQMGGQVRAIRQPAARNSNCQSNRTHHLALSDLYDRACTADQTGEKMIICAGVIDEQPSEMLQVDVVKERRTLCACSGHPDVLNNFLT